MDALWSFRNYDSGQIVGTGIRNGLMGAFLLTRCAERCSAHLGEPRFTERHVGIKRISGRADKLATRSDSLFDARKETFCEMVLGLRAGNDGRIVAGVKLLARESNTAAHSQLPSALARADLKGSRLRTIWSAGSGRVSPAGLGAVSARRRTRPARRWKYCARRSEGLVASLGEPG